MYLALGHRMSLNQPAEYIDEIDEDDLSTLMRNGDRILPSPARNVEVLTNAGRREATQSINCNARDFLDKLMLSDKSALKIRVL